LIIDNGVTPVSPGGMPLARTIRITGHVQGVFFREWTVKTATELGVTGWVRNCRDGSVEVHAIGEADLIERFLGELRQGPPAARVEAVMVEPAEPERVTGFTRRSTV
jgi:acylphosphatase